VSEKIKPLLSEEDLDKIFAPAMRTFDAIVDRIVETHEGFSRFQAVGLAKDLFAGVIDNIVRAEIQQAVKGPMIDANIRLEAAAQETIKEMMANQPVIHPPPFGGLPPIGS